MALYFLSYDLHKEPEDEYKKLWDELRKFKAVRILESDWCFKRLNTNAEGLRDHFLQFMHARDWLFIAEVADWASYRGKCTPLDLT